MAVLLPHLRRALGALLDAPAGLMSFEPDADFSALNTPVFLLDHSAKVVRRNEAAQRLLKMDDGLALRSDRLTLHDSDVQRDPARGSGKPTFSTRTSGFGGRVLSASTRALTPSSQLL